MPGLVSELTFSQPRPNNRGLPSSEGWFADTVGYPSAPLTGRAYSARVACLSNCGRHVRSVTPRVAAALVESGSAIVPPGGGKIREVHLVRTAATYAERIGPPSLGFCFGVRLTRWRRLEESGSRVIEHHPRSLLWMEPA